MWLSDGVCHSFEPEGLGSDTDTNDQVLQHHPGFDRRETCSVRSRAHGERGEVDIVENSCAGCLV